MLGGSGSCVFRADSLEVFDMYGMVCARVTRRWLKTLARRLKTLAQDIANQALDLTNSAACLILGVGAPGDSPSLTGR